MWTPVILFFFFLLASVGVADSQAWMLGAKVELPSSLEPVTSVAWDSIREEAYLSVTGEPHVLVADRKGVIRKIELGLPSSSWVGFRHDSLFVADGRSETLVILDLRSDKKEVLHWGYKMSDEHPVFYPSMILWDGTIWARARGLAEAPGPVPRMVYDREGAVRDTLGYTHRTRKWMTISDPNGRLPTEFRILDPLDPVDWVSVSANGQWASILNQTPERNGGVSVELTLEHFGVGRLKTSWTVPDALIPTEEVAALANRLGEALPPKEAGLFRLWLKSKLKGEHSRPPVTGLLQGVDGVVWLRRGLGTFGTREWSVIDPARPEGVKNVTLPVDMEVRWASRRLLIGISHLPRQRQELIFLSPAL